MIPPAAAVARPSPRIVKPATRPGLESSLTSASGTPPDLSFGGPGSALGGSDLDFSGSGLGFSGSGLGFSGSGLGGGDGLSLSGGITTFTGEASAAPMWSLSDHGSLPGADASSA